MMYLLTLVIATVSLYAGAWHLGQKPSDFYDFVAMAVVLGGTVAVSFVVLPLTAYPREVFYRLRSLFIKRRLKKSGFLKTCLDTLRDRQSGRSPNVSGQTLESKILREGYELIDLGFKAEKVEAILAERLYYSQKTAKAVGNAVRSLAKYPPAFGLAGTVLGLVNLMQGVAQGIDTAETGTRMAVALIATFYGLLIANLVINPAGEAINSHIDEEVKLGEIAIQACVLAAQNSDLLEAQETLNSFVAPQDRISLIESMLSSEAA